MPNKIESLDDGKKLKATLETGEVFEGDPLEITTKMAEAHVSTKRWGQDWKTKFEAVPPSVTPPPPTPNAEEAQLQKYLIDQHAKALGFNSGDEYKAELANVRAVTERQKNQAVAADFMQLCPDFPNDAKAIEAVMEKVKELGYENRPQDLAAAHMLCAREGKYVPLTMEQQNATWANNMSAANRQTAPPMIRSQAPDANAQVLDLSKEPLADMRTRIIREQLNGAS